MNNINVNKIEFGGLDQDGNTWLLEIKENEELNEIMGINTNVYHDNIFRVRYWAHVSNGKELKITIDINFDSYIEEHMTNLYREFETNVNPDNPKQVLIECDNGNTYTQYDIK